MKCVCGGGAWGLWGWGLGVGLCVRVDVNSKMRPLLDLEHEL